LGLLTCKNRRPYNLSCVGGDVKPCSINQSINGVILTGTSSTIWFQLVASVTAAAERAISVVAQLITVAVVHSTLVHIFTSPPSSLSAAAAAAATATTTTSALL